MPYKKPYRKKKSYRKKGFVKKLADKKINTLVEKRIKEIAQSEDRKNQVWYKPRTLVADTTFNWTAHGPYLRVPSASCLSFNAGAMFHLRLTDWGQIIQNQLNSSSGSELLSNYLRVRALKNRLDFRYSGTYDSHIKIWMVEIVGAQELAEQVTIPSIDTCPSGDMNGLNKYWPRAQREVLPYKYKILAKKDITLRAAKMYTNAYPTSNSGSNQGYTFTNAGAVHTETQKVCYLNKFYKGLGSKFQVDYDDARTPKREIYLCILGDTPITFNIVSCAEFRFDQILDSGQPSSGPQ